MQVFLLGLGVIAIALLVVQGRYSNVGISAVLMGLWAWQALAYHLAFFTAINPLAYVFAAQFLCGAAVFFWQGVVWGKMNFRITSGWRMWAGWGLLLAGVIGIVLLIRSKPARWPTPHHRWRRGSRT